MFRRNRLLLAALVVAAIPLAAFVIYRTWGNILDPLDAGRTIVEGRFVGQTKAAIEARYGKPTREHAGYYGKPDVSYEKEHSPAITTLYIRFSGRLFLSFEQREGEWVCFDSLWCPNGWDFD
jgi:hypothetical protein